MAIQNRRGAYPDFVPSKLLPGEWAVVQSGEPNSVGGTSVYMCFNAGNVKRMATYSEMQEQFNNMLGDVISTLTGEVNTAVANAEVATQYANGAGDTAIEKAQDAEAAANQVASALNDLAERVENGELDGAQGPQGIPGKDGADGANGIVVTASGQYAFQIKSDHLYVIYEDGTEAPDFEINESGHLILTI